MASTGHDGRADEVRALLTRAEYRVVVRALLAGDGRQSRDALARRLVRESPVESADRARLRLHHCCLPKLADLGVVRYDRGTGTVALSGERPAALGHLVALAAD